MAKYTLENNFDFNFFLIGIISSISEYKLCSILNRNLLLDLEREKSIELKSKKQQEYHLFSVFGHRDENSGNSVLLLNNSSSNSLIQSIPASSSTQAGLFDETENLVSQQKGKLIPELADMDYFLLLDGDFTEDEVYRLKSKMDESELVSGTRIINPDGLLSKNNLLF
jgi:hypothetical protein